MLMRRIVKEIPRDSNAGLHRSSACPKCATCDIALPLRWFTSWFLTIVYVEALHACEPATTPHQHMRVLTFTETVMRPVWRALPCKDCHVILWARPCMWCWDVVCTQEERLLAQVQLHNVYVLMGCCYMYTGGGTRVRSIIPHGSTCSGTMQLPSSCWRRSTLGF